jgi:hypothetical protein
MAARSPAIPRVYDDFDHDDTRLAPAALLGGGAVNASLAGRRSTGTTLMPAAQALVDQLAFVQAAPPIVRVRHEPAPSSGVHRVYAHAPDPGRFVPLPDAALLAAAPATSPGLSLATAVICGVVAGLLSFACVLVAVRALG